MGRKQEITNMASEFYVLSCLWRMGLPATLSLGSRKSIDIFVECNNRLRSIDVKGTVSKSPSHFKWGVGKSDYSTKSEHNFVFLRWERIDELQIQPDIYVIPAPVVERIKQTWIGGGYAVYIDSLEANGMTDEYRDNWRVLWQAQMS